MKSGSAGLTVRKGVCGGDCALSIVFFVGCGASVSAREGKEISSSNVSWVKSGAAGISKSLPLTPGRSPRGSSGGASANVSSGAGGGGRSSVFFSFFRPKIQPMIVPLFLCCI